MHTKSQVTKNKSIETAAGSSSSVEKGRHKHRSPPMTLINGAAAAPPPSDPASNRGRADFDATETE